MKPVKTTLMALISAVSLVAPMMAEAQQKPRPPAPPFGEMAQALGVPKEAIETCMPKPDQGQPGKIDTAALADCITATGSAVTEAETTAMLAQFPPPQKPKE